MTFPDVLSGREGHWALRQTLSCVDAGIVQGCPDSTYRPANAVTRDQMVVCVARAFGLPM